MQRLDKKVNHGVTKLTWSSPNIMEFAREACARCGEVATVRLEMGGEDGAGARVHGAEWRAKQTLRKCSDLLRADDMV